MMFISIMILIVAIALPSINRNISPNLYLIIVLISILGSLLLVSSSNLITLYLSLELQSFGVYILASLYRHSELAISAGLKYFLLGNLDSIYSMISVVDNNNILLGFSLGLILIFIGLLFKIAAAPLHN